MKMIPIKFSYDNEIKEFADVRHDSTYRIDGAARYYEGTAEYYFITSLCKSNDIWYLGHISRHAFENQWNKYCKLLEKQ